MNKYYYRNCMKQLILLLIIVLLLIYLMMMYWYSCNIYVSEKTEIFDETIGSNANIPAKSSPPSVSEESVPQNDMIYTSVTTKQSVIQPVTNNNQLPIVSDAILKRMNILKG